MTDTSRNLTTSAAAAPPAVPANRPSTTVTIDKWLGIVATVLAPTTVVTGLCYYFGLVDARKYYGYFGVDANSLGLTSSDYVMRSVSVLYPVIIALLALFWASLWLREYAKRAIDRGQHPRLVRFTAWACVAVGILLIVRGIVGVTAPRFGIIDFIGLTPGALCVGTGLLVSGHWILARRSAPPLSTPLHRGSQLIAVAVLLMALFWLTNIFATEYARHGANNTAAGLWRRETVVVLDTTDRLYAPPEFVRETMLPTAEGQKFRYRYECFRALEVRADRIVLVPAKWTPDNGYTFVLRFDDSSRVTSTRYQVLANADYDNYNIWKCPEIGQ
ncbi:hypothetical protein ACFV24_27020 [Nocardia fluminea]|uniref:hypothetical protein n=1 Tax=Nocardia fluminea TaxID=134984 RepID=UPI00366CD0E9